MRFYSDRNKQNISVVTAPITKQSGLGTIMAGA
jgi:hypothetical protein